MFTDIANARKALETMNQVIATMNTSLFDMRGRCPESEFDEYRVGIGGVMAEIFIRIRMKIYADFPELDPESQAL